MSSTEIATAHVAKVIGGRQRKLEAEASVSGRTRYVDDLRLTGMLFVRAKMAEVPFGRIVRLDTAAARALPGVHAVITAADVPHNAYGLGQDDQRVLCDGTVRYFAELVAAVAADDETIAQRAVDLIEVEYDLGAGPIFDPLVAMAPGAHAIHDGGNLVAYGKRDHREIRLGDAHAILDAAALTVEGTYSTQMREHASMEPRCSIAEVDPYGRLTVHSGTQLPHINRQQLAQVLDLPIQNVRMIVGNIGGGFGSKIDMIDDPITALLAIATGRPVKWRWTREQEFIHSSVDQPYAAMTFRSALTPEGRLLARSTRAVCDIGGENIGGGGGVVKFGIYARGPYDIPHYAYDGWGVFTNKNGSGAVRGYHVLDAIFGYESHMEACAAAIGADPLAFRLHNIIREGDTSSTGSVVTEATAYECAVAAAERIGWVANEDDIFDDRRPHRPASRPGRARGVGICIGISGAGLAGGGDPGSADVQINVDGTVDVRIGAPEDGAGEKTVMGMIAAEALQVGLDRISVISADTDSTPWSGGTFGNRVTFIDGNAVKQAAERARDDALEVAAAAFETDVDDLEWLDDGGARTSGGERLELAELAQASLATRGRGIVGHGSFQTGASGIDDDRGMGKPTGGYIFGACAVDLEVDVDTGHLEILKLVLCHDVGKAINTLFVEGQFDGGISWGIGAGITENVLPRYPDIRFQARGFDDYKIPTTLDMPPHENVILEIPSPKGPFGAKALGEFTANVQHAAITNAIFHATGARVTRLPATPETVWRALADRDGGLDEQ